MSAWNVQALQAVWFFPPSKVLDPAQAMQMLTGRPPAAIQQQVNLNLTVALADDGVSLFRVQQSPNRLDFFEQPLPSGPGFPLFPAGSGALNRFRGRLANLHAGDANRLALVATSAEPFASATDSVSAILSKTEIPLPFHDAAELHFQINRIGVLGKAGQVNRLLKWSTEAGQYVDMSGAQPVVNAVFLATLMVDVNTAQTPQSLFTPAEQADIFGEITDEVERLCSLNSLTSLT